MLAGKLLSKGFVVRGLALGVLASTVFGLSAVAQPGRGGGLSPEVRTKVQAAQATAVAADLKLDAEKSGKLVEAYAAYQKELAESQPADAPRGDREAMRKMMEERQAKLTESLKAFLDEAQAKEAAGLLGGFNRGWDRMLAVILEFGLGAEKEPQAIAHTLAYVKAGVKARQDSAGSGDFSAMRTALEAAKKTLDENLAPLLNDEQKAKWSEATTMGPRGGDRGNGAERRGEGADRSGRGGDNS